jgi:hypothetical protein
MKPAKPTPPPASTPALEPGAAAAAPPRLDRRLPIRTGLRAGPYEFL